MPANGGFCGPGGERRKPMRCPVLSAVSALSGKPVRLRFEMRSTKLFAFQFSD